MGLEWLDLYRQASAWTAEKIGGAKDLDAATPCDEWSMRDLLNHMLDTQRYFLGAARGEAGAPPGPNPPNVVSANPRQDFERIQADVVDAFSQDGVVEKTGPALGIASADQLLDGWDVARATGQDDSMPEGLAEASYSVIHGRLTDEQRKGAFKPEVPVGENATPQQRLLAYTGRDPN